VEQRHFENEEKKNHRVLNVETKGARLRGKNRNNGLGKKEKHLRKLRSSSDRREVASWAWACDDAHEGTSAKKRKKKKNALCNWKYG
jgi:hypothetical protein